MTTVWDRGRDVADSLRKAGFSCWFVGGCVRDHLLKRPVADIDLCTSATPDQIEGLFPRCLTVGKSFGVVVVICSDGSHVEVATYRKDGLYIDGRRPEEIAYATVEEDVNRRDFTINALLMDPWNGQIIDHVGGISDLEQRIIRVVGDPMARFHEDRLRVLRGIRFSANLGFQWDSASWNAACTTDIQGLSRERICQEIGKSMAGHHPEVWLGQIIEAGQIKRIFPEMEHNQQKNIMRALSRASHGEVRWAIILSSCINLAAWLDQQPLAKERRRLWNWLWTAQMNWKIWSEADRRRALHQPSADLLVEFVTALDPQDDIRQRFIRQQASGPFEPYIMAKDLLQAGIPPGPAIGRLLRVLEDAQLEAKFTTKAEAEKFLMTLLAAELSANA